MAEYSDIYDSAIGSMTGAGREKDPIEGARLMKEAAEGGYMPAVRDLGVMYVNGDGVERDPAKGAELLRRAVSAMDPRAMYHMALLYRYGVGVEADLYEALRLMGFAAGMRITGAEEDAEAIEKEIDAQRKRRIDARPILNLDVSEKDVEACCCRKMYDAVVSREIYHVDSFKGPVLMTEDEAGEEILVPKCPYCGARIRIVPHDKVY